jgi:hypothetical protein
MTGTKCGTDDRRQRQTFQHGPDLRPMNAFNKAAFAHKRVSHRDPDETGARASAVPCAKLTPVHVLGFVHQ